MCASVSVHASKKRNEEKSMRGKREWQNETAGEESESSQNEVR